MPSFSHGRALALHLPFIALLLVAAVSLAGCEEDASSATPASQPPPPKVSMRIMYAEPVPVTFNMSGRTTAFRKVEVRPQVNGVILKRLFEEGTTVKAGQPLYQIDPATYEAEVKAAKAAFARARATLSGTSTKAKRYRKLIARRAVSQQAYDDLISTRAEDQANVLASEAALETARIRLNYTAISAPIAGVIGRSWASEGALVTASQEAALTAITQLDPIYVDLSQSNVEHARARQAIANGQIQATATDGLPVRLTIDGLGDYAEEGRMQFSDVIVDAGTGTVSLRAVFPNAKHELLPGMFVRATVSQGVIPNAFLAPQAAVQRDATGEAFVWLVDMGDKIERRIVTVDRAVGQNWLVTDGLADGDRLAIDGLQRMQPGILVTPLSTDTDVEKRPSKPQAGAPAT